MNIPRPGKKTLSVTAGMIVFSVGAAFSLMYFSQVAALLRPALELIDVPTSGVVEGNKPDGPPSAADLLKEADFADKAADEADPELAQGGEIIPLVRTMQVSLEEMGQGDTSASVRLRSAMAAIHRLMLQPRQRKWSGAEQDAIVIYLLSGGSPDSVEKALTSASLSARRRLLLAVALAFVRGDTAKTLTKLESLDESSFPISLQSRLLMVKAQVLTTLPYEQRRDMLVKAADLAVGTLVEEAATRRLIELSSANEQLDDFNYWSQRYARRFAQSLYFGDFVSGFVKAVTRFEARKLPVSRPGLDNVVMSLPMNLRLAVIDTLQLAALRAGYTGLCHHMSELALRDDTMAAEEKQRTELYELACSAGEGKALPEELAKINVATLSSGDRALFGALAALSEGILTSASGSADPGYGPEQPSARLDAIHALSASVAQQLDATDKVLGGIVP